jgi:hypothetical protein
MSKIKKPWSKQLLTVIVSTVFILALILTTSTGCLTKKTGASVDNTDNPTDQATLLTALQQKVAEQTATIAALQQSIASMLVIPPPDHYATVVGLTPGHISVNVYGSGSYPVVIYLYGTALKANGVKTPTASPYSVVLESLSSNMLVEIVRPTSQWEANNTIELILLDAGTVRYVSASVGIG